MVAAERLSAVPADRDRNADGHLRLSSDGAQLP